MINPPPDPVRDRSPQTAPRSNAFPLGPSRTLGERGPFTRQESREALNFSLLPTVIILVGIGLSLIPAVGWIFALIASLTWVVLAAQSVLAGIKVNQGEPYQYRGNTHLYDTLQTKRSAKA